MFLGDFAFSSIILSQLKPPCDRTGMTINSLSILTNKVYTLGDPEVTGISFRPLTFSPTCDEEGTFDYQALYVDGSPVPGFLKFNKVTKSFSFYTDDVSDQGTHAIKIRVIFPDGAINEDMRFTITVKSKIP